MALDMSVELPESAYSRLLAGRSCAWHLIRIAVKWSESNVSLPNTQPRLAQGSSKCDDTKSIELLSVVNMFSSRMQLAYK